MRRSCNICALRATLFVLSICLLPVSSSYAELAESPSHAAKLLHSKKAEDPVSKKAPEPDQTQQLDAVRKLPSLKDLGLNLESSAIAKRNELDSLTVQPWTPGRGALGVKLEVTW